jgi:hypothetical protein
MTFDGICGSSARRPPACGRPPDLAGDSPEALVRLEAQLAHASFVEAKQMTDLVAHGLDDLHA